MKERRPCITGVMHPTPTLVNPVVAVPPRHRANAEEVGAVVAAVGAVEDEDAKPGGGKRKRSPKSGNARLPGQAPEEAVKDRKVEVEERKSLGEAVAGKRIGAMPKAKAKVKARTAHQAKVKAKEFASCFVTLALALMARNVVLSTLGSRPRQHLEVTVLQRWCPCRPMSS